MFTTGEENGKATIIDKIILTEIICKQRHSLSKVPYLLENINNKISKFNISSSVLAK